MRKRLLLVLVLMAFGMTGVWADELSEKHALELAQQFGVRSVRFRDDFITVYDGLDLLMAILYNQNKNNFMAADYYSAWQRLKQTEDVK